MKAKRALPILNNKGSALVSVFMVILVLLVLGAGILALSLSNTKQAVTADTYERSYYVADAGAKQGVERLKNAAMEYYRTVAEEVKNGTQTNNNSASFFAYMDAITYTPPQPDTSAGGPTSIDVSISHTTISSDTHRYSVLSTATGLATARKIQGSIDITFVPIVKSASAFTPLGSETVLVGGTFNQTSGDITIQNNGTVRFGAYTNPRSNPPSYSNYDGFNIANKSSLNWIDPNTRSSLNWDMQYPGFTEESKTAASPTLPIISNGATISSLGGNTSPIYLEGAAGASFTFKSVNSGFTGGQIWCDKKLTVQSATLDGNAGNYIKLYSGTDMAISSTVLDYCKLFSDANLSINGGGGISNLIICSRGDMTIGSTTMTNLKIYCGGNLTINGGSSTNVTIYCAGTITDNSNTRTNMKVYCDSYSMSGGNIVGDSIVYAESYIHLESTVSGLIYSNGNIDIGSGSGLTGQMAAKGNVNAHGSFSYRPDSTLLARLNVDPFTTSSPGGGSGSATVVQPANPAIFPGTPSFSEQ